MLIVQRELISSRNTVRLYVLYVDSSSKFKVYYWTISAQ